MMKLDWRSPYAKRVLLTAVVATVSIACLLLVFRMLEDSGNILIQLSKFSALVGNVLTPFLLAMLLGYMLLPIVRFFERRLFGLFLRGERWTGLRRGLSVLLTYLLLVLGLIWLLGSLWPVLWANVQEFWTNAPHYIDTAQEYLSEFSKNNPLLNQPSVSKAIQSALDSLELEISVLASEVLQRTIDLIKQLTNSVTNAFITLVGSIYCLLDGPRMLRSLQRLTQALFGQRRCDRLVDLSRLFERIFGVYVRSRLLESVVVFALVYISFLFFRIPYSALFALVNGITNLVPYFGPIVGCVLTMAVLVLIDPMQALYAGVLITIVQQIDGYILGPKFMGENLHLRPLYVMLSVTAGGAFFGVPGMLLTVPFVAFFGALLSRFIQRRLSDVAATGVKQP